MLKKKKLIVAFSIIPLYLIVKLLARYPEFIETYYSKGLYPITSKMLRYTFGWIPFSIGDLLYTVAGIYAIRWLILNRKRIRKDTKNWVLDILSVISIAYLGFHLFWGMNYYRLPIHKTLDLGYKYTTEELVKATEHLINISNTTHLKISSDDSLKVEMPYSKKELLKMTSDGYTSLAKTYPYLAHSPQSTKLSLYSIPLTYMGFSGYLNPFTNEAHIDGIMPLYQFPTTASHEQAHQLGYAAENETNFIGCLAAIHHDDIYFQYSGYVFALRYCLNEVYRRDKDIYKNLIEKVNKGILKNYQESYDFWNSYENPLEPVFKIIYGNFLKANNQDKGIESYSYVVALLVNYFKTT